MQGSEQSADGVPLPMPVRGLGSTSSLSLDDSGNYLSYGYEAANGCGADVAAGSDGNRTFFGDYRDDGSSTTASYCYDNADRLTGSFVSGAVANADPVLGTSLATYGSGSSSATLAYDAHGNTATLADQTLSYDQSDRLTRITSTGNGVAANAGSVSYVRDATDRVVSETTVSGGVSTTQRFEYSGDGDSADLITTSAGAVTDRILTLLAGVVADRQASGTAWSYPNVHGDVFLTGTQNGDRSQSLSFYDPFGNVIDPATEQLGTVSAAAAGPASTSNSVTRFGWEGSHSKVTDHAGDISLIEMGARGYEPLLGRFLQVDPVPGGNVNDYVYPNDPLNQSDLTGEQPAAWQNDVAHWMKNTKSGRVITAALAIASYIPGPIGFWAGQAQAAIAVAEGDSVGAAIDEGSALLGGGVGKILTRAVKIGVPRKVLGAISRCQPLRNPILRYVAPRRKE